MAHNAPNLDGLKAAWSEKYRAKEILQAAKSVNFQIQQGDRFLGSNKLAEAITCYRHALKIDPDSTKAKQQLVKAIDRQKQLVKVKDLNPILNKNSNIVAQVYLQQAQFFAAEGQWISAIASCQEAIEFDPNLAEAYKVWGDNLHKLGKISEAMGCYAKALAINPNYAEVCLNLGSLSFQQQQWQLSINYYQKAIEIQPNCVSAYRNLARAYKKLGNKEQMLDCWFQALQIDPNSASVAQHCDLAKIMLERGRLDKAIALFQNAIKLKPNIADLYLNLGRLLIEQNRSIQAIELYRQGLKYLPHHSAINFELAQLLIDNNPQQAIIHYQQVVKTQPKFAPAYYKLAEIYTQQKQEFEAVKYYQQALKLDPHKIRAWLQLAELSIGLKQWHQATIACQEGLKLDSQQWQLYHYLGIALLHQQKYSLAIKVYDRCLKINPGEVDCYHNLGIALIAESKWAEAIACYQQIAQHDPNNVEVYRKIGETAIKVEQWMIALQAFNRAIELCQSDSWLYHHLGMTLINLERWIEASQALQKSIDLNPEFPWSYYHLGDALTMQQRWQESTEAYRYFLTKETSPYAYERLGDNLLKQIELFTPAAKPIQEEACQCYYRAIEVDPDYIQPYYKLMELKPYDPEVSFMLAETYARQEEWSTAVVFYQMGLQLKSDFHEIHLELGIVLEQLNQLDNAIFHYKKAIALNPDEPKYRSYLEKAEGMRNEE